MDNNPIELRFSVYGLIAVLGDTSLRLVHVDNNDRTSTFELKNTEATFSLKTDLHPLTKDREEWSISWMWGLQHGGEMIDDPDSVGFSSEDTPWIFEAMNVLIDGYENIRDAKKRFPRRSSNAPSKRL